MPRARSGRKRLIKDSPKEIRKRIIPKEHIRKWADSDNYFERGYNQALKDRGKEMKLKIIEIKEIETDLKEIYYITILESKERPNLKLGECKVNQS